MAARKKTSPEMAAKILALVEESLEEDQANDVIVIPLAGKTDIAEFMVVASGRSARHVDASTDHLLTKLKNAGVRGVRSEGREIKDWVLIDAGHVIVNLFRPEVRAYYDLEKLWESGPVEGNLNEVSTV
ncbi:MAG: ribosome-associated protein [Alphaproteobacteria bacterium]